MFSAHSEHFATQFIHIHQGCPHFFDLQATFKITKSNDLPTLEMLNIFIYIYVLIHFIYTIYVDVPCITA